MDVLGKAMSLLGVDEVLKLIKVLSPYGREAKGEMKLYGPNSQAELEADLDLLDAFVVAQKRNPQIFANLRQNLSHLKEVGESLENAVQGLALSSVELYEIKMLLMMTKRIQGEYGNFLAPLPAKMKLSLPFKSEQALDPHGDGLENFYIGDHYSHELAQARQQLKAKEGDLRNLRIAIAKKLMQDYEGLRFRPNGTALVSKADRDRYLALISDNRLYLVDEHYETVSFGIVANADIDGVMKTIEALKWDEEQAIYNVRLQLSQVIASEIEDFRQTLMAFGLLDLYVAKAALAIGVNGIRPTFVKSGLGLGIDIILGRHIGVEQRLRRENRAYTPITVRFDTPVALITGANMGGKTIALKMIGQVVIMAHFGLYVAAQEAKMPLMNYVAAAIGDEQSMDMGLSTFGAEIVALKEAINQADREGLILIDELARGTNPTEGAALSRSIVDYLSSKPSYAVITTHFDGLTATQNGHVRHWQVKGLKSALQLEDTDDLKDSHKDLSDLGILAKLAERMDYSLVPVSSVREVPREALHIAKIMGLPSEILDKAKIYMK